jgi:hypothetical protein
MQTSEPVAGPKESLRATQILCLALMVGILVFSIIVVVLNMVSGPALKDDSDTFKNILLYIVAGVAVVCSITARTLYNKGLTGVIDSKESLTGKLNEYRALLILYMAPCEGAALFAVIALFLTGNYFFLIIISVMLLLMFSKMPLKAKVINELKIEWLEQQELE